MSGIDELSALLRISFRQQTFGRGFDEGRITVVAVAVRIGELERLDHGMDVVGAVMLHGVQIELLQYIERFEQDRSLAAKPMLVNLITAVSRHARLLDPGKEFREIIAIKWRLMLLEECDHVVGNA